MNLLPRFAVVDELSEHDKVQKHGTQASHQPREALDEVVTFGALEQDTRDVGQVARNGKDEQGQGKALAFGGAVLEDLWNARGEVEDCGEPTCDLGVPSPSDGFWGGSGLLDIIVTAVVVFGDPPCCYTRSDDQQRGERVHDDLGADGGLVVFVVFGREIVFDDVAVANERSSLVGFERGRDGGDLHAAVVVFSVVPVLEDEDAVACAVVEGEDDLQDDRSKRCGGNGI